MKINYIDLQNMIFLSVHVTLGLWAPVLPTFMCSCDTRSVVSSPANI